MDTSGGGGGRGGGFDGDFRTYERAPSYDVSADGRFVTTTSDAAPSISVLLNWPEALRHRSDPRGQ